jgi:acetolactate synthase-1/2/3 large subunit
MKISDYIAHFFYTKGIDTIFGYQGGMITHLVDSIYRHSSLRFVQVYHEQSGAFAAEGYARMSDKPGVCISTSGPGATNMITGIADAWFDSIPVIYISGQVNTHEYKYDKTIRQQGFQEMDIVSVVRPITKYAVMVDDPSRIVYELEKSYQIAMSGRKGPVLLDIPMNIFRVEIEPATLESHPTVPPDTNETKNLPQSIELIRQAQRPAVLAGGGVVSAGAQKELQRFIDRTGIPVMCSLMGKSSIDERPSDFMGMVGAYGNRAANMLVHEADVVIAVGSRLDTRQTGARYKDFLRNGTIIHVDIDAAEIREHRMTDNRLPVICDAKYFLNFLNEHIGGYQCPEQWRDLAREVKSGYDQAHEIERFVENKTPYRFLELLNKFLDTGHIVTADIGQNQMWAAQTLTMPQGSRFLTSGGLAPMGYAIPAAVGAAFATGGKKKIWAIAGDGGFHMSTQALMLISQYNLPVTVIVLNNESLGMITQFQELYFDSRFAATDKEGGYRVPDIGHMAASYGLNYQKVTQGGELPDLMLYNGIVEVFIPDKTKVYPKLEFDKPFNMPSPPIESGELDRLLGKIN